MVEAPLVQLREIQPGLASYLASLILMLLRAAHYANQYKPKAGAEGT